MATPNAAGQKYQYNSTFQWFKVQLLEGQEIYILSVDYNLWEAVVNSSYVPISAVDGRMLKNHLKDCDGNERKKTDNRC